MLANPMLDEPPLAERLIMCEASPWQSQESVLPALGVRFVSGFVLADVTWTDEEGRREYIELLGPSLTIHGGEVLATSSDAEVMEGDWQPGAITVLISFPTREAARAWYTSGEYRPALNIRKRSSNSRLLILG